MAKEEKVIIELDIKTDKAIADTIALKEKVSDMKKELKRLKEAGDENSEAYLLLNAQLKANEKQLRANETQLASMAAIQQVELGTLEKARLANAELRAEKEKLNLETEQGKKRLKEINDEMDANNQLIKESGNAAQQQASNIGNYPKKIEVINTSLGQIPTTAEGAANGFKGMAQAAKAFLLNPIALTVAAIVVVLLLLKKALEGTEEGQNKMNKITGMLSGALNALMKVLRPLATFLADYVIFYFETLGKVADKAIGIVSKGLSILGFEKAAKAVDGFNESIKETMKSATELADAEAELQRVQRNAEKIQLDYQKAAEKQRQIRDDESKSMKERVEANEKLNVVLQEQIKAELAIANQALKVAELRIKAEGESTDALNQRAEALTKISDIQERITGQESEYLANVNALRKEQQALDKAASDEKKKKQEEEKKQKEEAAKQEIERLKKEAEDKIALLNLELREFSAKNKSKLESSNELTSSLIEDEILRQKTLKENADAQLKIQAEAGLISDKEYKVSLLENEVEFNLQKQDLQTQFAEQEKQKRFEEAQYQFQLNQDLLNTSLMGEFEAKTQALLLQQAQEEEFADKTILTEEGKAKALADIQKKYDKAERAIKLAKFQAELSLAGDFAKNIAEIAGKNSKIGKTASAAATTISTLQGGVAAFTGMATAVPGPVGIGMGIAAAAAALTSGYANVKKILSTNSGLPGDGSVSGGGGEGGQAPAISATAPILAPSINPSLGQGIVSRQVQDNSTASMQTAFSNALIENPLRPTLVTDDVTVSQSKIATQNKTASI